MSDRPVDANEMIPTYRLVNERDAICPDDERLCDDCVTWEKITGEFVGAAYNGNFFVPMRRRISPTAETAPKSESETALPRAEDMALLIRRLCRVIAKHEYRNTVRTQALDYLERHGLGGSPLKTKGQL